MVKTGQLGQDFYNAVQKGMVSDDIIERLNPTTNIEDETYTQETKEEIMKNPKYSSSQTVSPNEF